MLYPTRDEFMRDFDVTKFVELGQGAFGRVVKIQCKYQDLKLEVGKFYAAKFIEVVHEGMFNKIQNEFKINKMIEQHSHIITVYKCYAWQELMPHKKFCLVFILELADHSLNKEILTRKKQRLHFSQNYLMEFFTKCLKTFQSLVESKQIYHRDIKPENILLLNDEPKITDFGVSKTLYGEKINQSLRNTLVGTPVYLSPVLWNALIMQKEQKASKIKHDLEKSDIFSLGITFLQCVLLTDDIIDLNQPKGQQKKMDLLDSIDNPKFRGLIESMIELDEAKRGSYKYLIETFCNSNPKGIFLANKAIIQQTEDTSVRKKQKIFDSQTQQLIFQIKKMAKN
ncbi:hypothetical protein pb186bvf_010786 [Paramecium bursaria]